MQGEGGKNGDFWMTSFLNDPLYRYESKLIQSVNSRIFDA